MTVWWRWMRDALSPTADEVERLIDPGPEGWRQHSAAATVPTEGMIASVTSVNPLLFSWSLSKTRVPEK